MSEKLSSLNQEQPPAGVIRVAPRAIYSIIAHAVVRVPGVVGLAPRNITGIVQALSRADSERGILLQQGESSLSIELFAILEYGSQIAEVARSLQAEVRRAVEQALNLPIAEVKVHIQSLQKK